MWSVQLHIAKFVCKICFWNQFKSFLPNQSCLREWRPLVAKNSSSALANISSVLIHDAVATLHPTATSPRSGKNLVHHKAYSVKDGSPRPIGEKSEERGSHRFSSVTLSHSPNALLPLLQQPFVTTNEIPLYKTGSVLALPESVCIFGCPETVPGRKKKRRTPILSPNTAIQSTSPVYS